MKRWLGVVVLVMSGAAMSAGAQVAPYAMFSLGHYSGIGVGPGTAPNQSGGVTAMGGTLGVYDNFLRMGPARLGADVRGVIENSANSTPYGNKMAAGLFGLRVDGSGIPAFPFNPYVQAEIGVAGTNNGTSRSKESSFAYQLQIGGDVTIFPHVAARVEYGAGQMTSIGGRGHTLQTFGVGLVVRL
ncbi:MAG: hypothetical protein ABI064_07300 [Acidobacteriaceae bacterium]